MDGVLSDHDKEALAAGIAEGRSRIAAACDRAGRDPAGVTLVAATKYGGPGLWRALIELGVADLGENRVDRLAAAGALALPGARWHMIGHLQSNKARRLPGVELLHSLDSLRLAKELARREASSAALVQVNVAGEEQKSGVAPDELPAFLDAVSARGGIELRGLMTMAPNTDDAAVIRRCFRGLRELRDGLRGRYPELLALSMGMSGDFEIAVEEGATIVRLGRILYQGLEGLEDDRARLE